MTTRGYYRLLDALPVADEETDRCGKDAMGAALARLDPEDRRILGLIYSLDGEPRLSVAGVAGELRMACHRVQTRRRTALGNLRRHLEWITREGVPKAERGP